TATGGAFLTATFGTVICSLIGGQNAGTAKGRAVSAFTITAAPTIFDIAGISHQAALDTGVNIYRQQEVDFDGRVVVPPGNLFYPVATLATGALYWQSFSWQEVPV